ncbi:MAG: lipase family protein [Bacteroidota bacterium]
MTQIKIFTLVLLSGIIFQSGTLRSQNHQLQPGFDKAEYREMLKMAACVVDTPWQNSKLVPDKFRLIFRSPVIGLDNRWDLWIDEGSVAVISIRGTTEKTESWLENFYAAMVPASGSMKLTADQTFTYKLSENPRAAVHIGWLMATGYMSQGILSKIDSCYRRGIWDFIITGHSQGGGISFLMTAYLLNLQKNGALPADIRFKTYCSAAPKPGNLYFAYDYENMTYGGWAFNVVNSADWVPETPLSIQTIQDFNAVNPFVQAEKTIKKQKLPTRLAMGYAYGKLDRPTRRAVKNYRKYLGKVAGKFVNKSLPGFQSPDYLFANHYVRTGSTIVLYADEMYYKNYPDNTDNVFIHHMAGPYLYLLRMMKD